MFAWLDSSFWILIHVNKLLFCWLQALSVPKKSLEWESGLRQNNCKEWHQSHYIMYDCVIFVPKKLFCATLENTGGMVCLQVPIVSNTDVEWLDVCFWFRKYILQLEYQTMQTFDIRVSGESASVHISTLCMPGKIWGERTGGACDE